jgi:ATP-dependent protease ClpP protease subunit
MEFLLDLPKEHKGIWDLYVPILKTPDGRYTEIFLTEGIGDASEYNEACHLLRTAKAGDIFKLIINNGGGSTATSSMLVDAMKNSKATINGYATGFVCSAATTIMMACEALEVADNTHFMFHNYSHGAQGSGAQVKSYVDYIDEEFSKQTRIEYANFLTEEEMDLISKHDKEIWLNSKDVRERWEKKNEAN